MVTATVVKSFGTAPDHEIRHECAFANGDKIQISEGLARKWEALGLVETAMAAPVLQTETATAVVVVRQRKPKARK